MIIAAKYDGKCPTCGSGWEIGDEIWWTKVDGAQCLDCHQDDETNDASPVKPVQKDVTVRYNPPKE